MKTQSLRSVVIAVAILVPAAFLAIEYLVPLRAIPHAQQPVTLKIQSSYPSGLTMYEQLEMFADTVQKVSGGRIKIEALPAGAIVGAFEVLDATNRGILDGAHTYALYWVGKHRASILFGGAPAGSFGLDLLDFMGWYYEGGGLELYQEFYRDVLKMNVVPITTAAGPPSPFGWFKKPIKDWQDLKGTKFRIVGISADIFKELGVTVVTTPGGEIIPAAERGVIDGAEFLGGVDDMNLGFPTIWKNHYGRMLHEYTWTVDFLINRNVWEKLSPDLRDAMKAAAMDSSVRWAVRYIRRNAEAAKQMVEKHGVTVWKTPEDILRRYIQTWDKVAEREAAKDPFFKKVLESQKRYASLVVPYRLSLWPNYDFAAEHYWKKEVYAKDVK